MRGTYFVKHLKGNSGNQVQKLADCQAFRTKVAHVVVYVKKKKVESDNQISKPIPISRVYYTLHVWPLVLSDFGPVHKLAEQLKRDPSAVGPFAQARDTAR